jgi:hypothetical protein
MFSAIRRRKKLADVRMTVALAFAAFLLVPAAQAFAVGTATVEIGGKGSGEVASANGTNANFPFATTTTSPAIACAYNGSTTTGTCKGELGKFATSKFETMGVFAIPSAGSAFVEWKIVEGVSANTLSGTEEDCLPGSKPVSSREETDASPGGPSAHRSCMVFNESSTSGTGSANVIVKAVFAKAFPLTVFLAGKGKVESAPSGLTCAGEECKGEFAESSEVTLTATPETGYVFAGWLGCKHTGATTCKVTMSEAKEATAVFMAEGKEGATGPGGTNGTNGKEGPAGPAGASGKEGPAGKEGSAGKEGPAGKAGANGAQGPGGAAGPAGSAGRDAQVTCTVKQPKKGKGKVSVTCKVTLVAKAASARVHWSLTHGHRLLRRGVGQGASLSLGRLARGRYVLHVQGSGGGTVIVVG